MDIIPKDEVCKRFRKYFKKLVKHDDEGGVAIIIVGLDVKRERNRCREEDMTKEELKRAIMFLKNRKVRGIDVGMSEIVKSGGEIAVE